MQVILVALAITPHDSAIGASQSHRFLSQEVARTIEQASIVRAYGLALPASAQVLSSPALLGGMSIAGVRVALDAEQRGFLKWAILDDKAHDEIPKGYASDCPMPSMGLRFVSATDSVDVTISPSCFSTWRFSMSRGADWDHLRQIESSFGVIRPEMLTLLRELFPGESDLKRGKGAPYRSNWPLHLPAAQGSAK
jgi:hypothetical protein